MSNEINSAQEAVAIVKIIGGAAHDFCYLAAGLADGEYSLFAAPVAAAPGIDQTNCLQHTHAVIDKMQDVMAVHGFTVPVRVISDAFRTTLLCQQDGLIDASPKG